MAKRISDNARRAYQMLSGMGYKPHIAAGLVGNLIQESGWNIDTKAVGDNGNAFGSAQWNGPRRRAYKAWASNQGLPVDGLGTQIAYLDHEMKTSERSAAQAIMGAGTVRDAAVVASNKFWRPGHPALKNRMRNAEMVLAQMVGTGTPKSAQKDVRVAGSIPDDVRSRLVPYQPEQQPQAQQSADSGIPDDVRARLVPYQPENEQQAPDQQPPVDIHARPARQGDPSKMPPDPRDRADVDAQAGADRQPAVNIQAASQPVQKPTMIERGLNAVGEGISDFVDTAGQAMGSIVNEFYSGGQGIDPTKVDRSKSIGFLEQEVGGAPYVLIEGLDGSPDRKVPMGEFSGKEFFTQVDPQSGRTLVIPRTPDVVENSPILNAGRVIGLAGAANLPMGSVSKAPKATGQAALAAQAARNLDVTPSFGMTGPVNGRIASVGNDNLITTGPFRADAERAVSEMSRARESIAEGVGDGADKLNAGDALRSGAQDFVDLHIKGRDGKKSISSLLLERVTAKLPTDTVIDVSGAANTLKGFLKQFPNLGETAKDLGITRWQGWIDDIEANGGQLRWDEVRALRTMIGESIGKINSTLGDRSTAQVRQLYGALSDDLGRAAEAAGPEVAAAWQRYNKHYRQAAAMTDQALDIIFKAKGPEQAYERLMALGKDRGQSANVRKLIEIRKAIPQENWSQVVSTVIRQMGTVDGGFSPARFLTEWKKLSGPAKEVLFTGRKVPKGLKTALDDLVRVAENSAGAERLLNHSNSGANIGNLVTGGAIAGAVSTMDVITMGLGTLGIGATRGAAALVTSPAFLKAFRAYIASGGAAMAGKRVLRTIANTPELASIPLAASRHTQQPGEPLPPAGPGTRP